MGEEIGLAEIFCAIGFGLFFIICFCVFIYSFYLDFIKTRKYIKTQGSVVRHEKTGTWHRGHDNYRAVATFDIANEIYEVNSRITGYPPSILPPIGVTVDIKFNPDDPSEALWATKKDLVFYYTLLLIITIAMGFGVYCFLFFDMI